MLTDAGVVELARQVGPRASWIEGIVQNEQKNSGPIELGVRIVALRSGEEQYWSGETVTIPSEHVARVEERFLSRWRTAAASVGLVGGVAVLLRGLSEAVGSDGGNGGRPGQQ